MIAEVEEKRKDIQDLCERYGVIRLAIFGSAARGEFDPATSDLDFLVLFDRRDQPDYVERYLDMADALEALFARKVDLVTELSARSPYFRAAIEKDLESIYVRPDYETAA
jgi:predicted nucleotidyltransferase